MVMCRANNGTRGAARNYGRIQHSEGVSFMRTLTSLLDAKASRMAEQADGLGRGTAESLHAAASSIRKGSKAIEDLAESTANKLDGAGKYVEKHNLKRAIGESRQLVRRYPAESLVL